jgi:hypothetical protein
MLDEADKFLKITVGLGVLLAGAGIGYHHAIYLPGVEQQKIDMEREKIKKQEREKREEQERAAREESQKKLRYNICLDNARSNYDENWKNDCKRLKRRKDCTLPVRLAEGWNNVYENDQKRCLDELKSGVQ